MSEANHATALGLNCEQFLHGPWAALEPDDVVFLIAPPGPAYERGLAIARVAKEVGAPVVALVREDDRAIAPLAAETIAIPPVSELLSPILTVVPLQLFTYHLALRRGGNPHTTRGDQPPPRRAPAGARRARGRGGLGRRPGRPAPRIGRGAPPRTGVAPRRSA